MESIFENLEVLLIHDGELGDVRDVLSEIGARVVETQGLLSEDCRSTPWDLVVGSARHMLEEPVDKADAGASRIAVAEDPSKTLCSMLQRANVDLVVRRPVHPSALRLLLLHSLYRGPEKRRAPRVSVGASVTIRFGLRRRNAVLVDLSETGCRLLTPYAPPRGQNLRIYLPADLAGGRAMTLRGRVVRCGASHGGAADMRAVATRFEGLTKSCERQLHALVALHADGPAILECRESGHAGERRDEPRRETNERVVALQEEAMRVLIARDVSTQGLRVAATGDLAVEDRLVLVFHVRGRSQPLVLDARVDRDDGEEGFALLFENVDEGNQRYLERMVEFLPMMATDPRAADTSPQGSVVAEVREHISAPAPALA